MDLPMGKHELREVVVRRTTTVLLLILTTVIIATVTLWLTGKAYRKVDPVPFHEIRLIAHRLAEGHVTVPVLVALATPMLLNILLFLPWGFLMFLALDRPERPTIQSYLLTILFGIAFSASVEVYQYFLPSRVTDVNDVIWNGVGAVVGAFLGHLRRRVRVSFE
jgi:glycopeptide antibiotics resistance protein